MAVFLGTLAAMLLDPIVLIVCWISAAFAGVYRVAVPLAVALGVGIFIAMSGHPLSAMTVFMFALVGAMHGAIGLTLWRLVPERFKRAMTNN